ncbi:TPA: IS3 family transposase [Escherichia coli]|nr:IS3 family transposase [Escherichia coli]
MRRTFTAEEKASVFELWKNGTGFSEIANILGSKPGTIFTMLRDTGGIKPHERKRAVAHLTLSEREEIRAGLSAKMSIRAITDITYIRTHEGWLYLAVVVDLFSRKIIGWSMQSRMTKDIVLNALLMAVWRRNPEKQVLVHSDQGSQYTSHEWQSFLKSHGLEGSMSRRGNCHDNAVAESFFQLLKRERIKKKIYGTREEARSDIFDYIEMFYNSKRRHGSSDQMSPTEYENQYYQRLGSV